MTAVFINREAAQNLPTNRALIAKISKKASTSTYQGFFAARSTSHRLTKRPLATPATTSDIASASTGLLATTMLIVDPPTSLCLEPDA